jgi:hypothetical protein
MTVGARSLASAPDPPAREGNVSTKKHRTAPLGELIASAFDDAARDTDDPRAVSRRATRAVLELLRRSGELNGSRGPVTLLEAARTRD